MTREKNEKMKNLENELKMTKIKNNSLVIEINNCQKK
jgi:hypothetical protein